MQPNVRELSFSDLCRPLSLETGRKHILRLRFPKLHVRLPIDPRRPEHEDDRFILTIEVDGRKTEIERSVKDDRVAGDAYIDLIFGRLRPGAHYTLVVDPGAQGRPYPVFERRPHDELFAT